MPQKNYLSSLLWEHRFWLQILGDHARFAYHFLSPNEDREIKQAEAFILEFDRLLHQSRQNLAEAEISSLQQQISHAVKKSF